MRRSVSCLGMIVLACALWVRPSAAQIPTPPDGERGLGQTYTGRVYSPYADRDFPSMVYWGDTHLHTSLSMDAGAFGNRLGLDEAYRFARGEQVTASSGQKARLNASRPSRRRVAATFAPIVFSPSFSANPAPVPVAASPQDPACGGQCRICRH